MPDEKLNRPRPALWQRLLVALLIIVAASVFRTMFFGGLGRGIPYLLYYPAVMLAALYGGLPAGLLATALSAPLCFFWIQRGVMSPPEWLALVVFVLSCILISYVCEVMHRAQAEAKRAQEKTEAANRELPAEITERLKAEGALQREEKFDGTLLDNLAEGVVACDARGTLVLFNRTAREWHGLDSLSLPPEEWGRHCDLYKPDGTTPLATADIPLFRAFHGETVREAAMTIVAKGRPPRHVLASGGPFFDAQNHLLGAVMVMHDITARRQTEEDMRLQNAALMSAANGIVITDRSGTIVWANPAFSALTGYSLTEAFGKNPRDLLKSGQHARAFYAQMWDTIMAGRVWHGELVNRRKDGTHYPEEMTLTPMRDAKGEITHFIAIKQDLTARRQGEAALRASEEHYRSIAQAVPDAIVTADAEGRVCDWNPAAERIFGYSKAEVHGEPLEIIIPLRFRDRHRDGLQRLLAGGEPPVVGRTVELAGLRRDGTEFPLELSLARWASSAGAFFTAIIRDISTRELAESNLRQSEEHYRLLFDHNPLPMWVHDTETLRFLSVNESAMQHYGYTREEFLGMTLPQICNPDDVPLLLQRQMRDRTEGGANCELRHRRKNGTTFHVETFSRPLTFASRPAQLSLVNDITEKKLLEDRFLHAQRLESIGMLATGIAHDLNNVLAPIVFATPMLREGLSSPRDLKIVDTLEKSVARGANLVKQILSFAHTATGEFQATQVKHLARDIIAVIEETFPKSVTFEHHIPSDLWPVQGNATQIHQALLNLCVNARDAMPHGGKLRLIATNRRLDAAEAASIPGALPGVWLVLEVADTGTGIAPDVLEHIWTPFFTTKAVGKGTGLGLSTVRGIVAGHHGFIELDTQVGRGTSFRVFLPAIESATLKSPDPLAPVQPGGHGELILVVEDETAIRQLICDILHQHRYRVLGAAHGVEALELFGSHPGEFSLVITDVDMPRLGGLKLTQALLKINPGLPLLAMSGLSRSIDSASDIPAIQAVAHAFLRKPFTSGELLSTVYQLLHPAAAT